MNISKYSANHVKTFVLHG